MPTINGLTKQWKCFPQIQRLRQYIIISLWVKEFSLVFSLVYFCHESKQVK